MIGNSVKFTSNGIVKIIIDDFSLRTLKISILDTGSGIN